MTSRSDLAFAELMLATTSAPMALVRDGRGVVFANPAFRRLFADDDLGSSGEAFVELAAEARPGASIELERDGRRFSAHPTPVEGGGEPLTLWTLEDLTELAAEQQQREESLSVIVHDLRGPLAGVRGTLDFLLDDPDLDLPPIHRDLVVEAQAESKRLMGLVTDILDLAKVRSRKKGGVAIEPVNPMILVRRAILAVRSLAAKEGVALQPDVDRGAPPIAGDMDKLLQVLNNLIVNAIKFTPAKGLIVVAAEPAPDDPDRVVVSVTDTGPGIPIEKQDALFRKFAEVGTETDTGIAGTGLGLFIAKTMIEAFDGRIVFASIPGAGTAFLAELPVYRSRLEAPASASATPA